ncbi:uncharacterized protein LOC119668651 [Teleopsis dalmanni]|uniref:uncharacterized protein LOC119668651 n=1 Tax=Teleopsis dalmanni TaxID=139649 RepID=UPI0018CF6662|nr:uncharacterized protein LOC119668651 [Teleopsis dalmanni]
MALTSNTPNVTPDHNFYVSLGSVGVLLCMIVSLLGIKIWWFKHRLTFDQNSTRNGAAGGGPPSVVSRPRSSRDKRFSQQIDEPVTVHGVFRKRQEDELLIERPTRLPPIRVRELSQSTPSLFVPPAPRKCEEDKTSLHINDKKLQYEEPKMPSLPTTPIPDIAVMKEADIQFPNMLPASRASEENFEKIVVNEIKLEVPKPPPRLTRQTSDNDRSNGHKFVKMKPAPENESKRLMHRRPTGYLPPDEDELLAMQNNMKAFGETNTSNEQFGERRPTGYIKYEEFDVEGLEAYQENWDNSVVNLSQEDFQFENNFTEQKPIFIKNGRLTELPDSMENDQEIQITDLTDGSLKGKENEINYFEVTKEQLSAPLNIQDEFLENRTENAKLKFELNSTEIKKDKYKTPNSPNITEVEEDFSKDASSSVYNENNDNTSSGTVEYSSTGNVNKKVSFEVVDDESDDDGKDTIKIRRPTGYVRNQEILLENVDTASISSDNSDDRKRVFIAKPNENIKVQKEYVTSSVLKTSAHSTNESHMWLEMEKDIENSVASNFEEEFIKIRQSYEENEGDFLEIQEETVTTPQGFGKSIDDDWENFKYLENTTNKIVYSDSERINKTTISVKDSNDQRNVKFDLPNYDENEEIETSLRTQRRATGYITNIEELYQELDLNDIKNYEHDTKVRFNIDDMHEVQENRTKNIGIKERRPTGLVKYDLSNESDLSDDCEGEEQVKNVEPIRKAKPRQKVTFDFNTEEYILPAYSPQSESEFELPPELPKPMERITKTRYTEETTRTAPISPLLFSSQISIEDTESSNLNDSWSAIRKHRNLTEEFQHLSFNREPVEPPKPAFRNPLAQMQKTNESNPQKEALYAKPRTMRDMKKAKIQQEVTQLELNDDKCATSMTEA